MLADARERVRMTPVEVSRFVTVARRALSGSRHPAGDLSDESGCSLRTAQRLLRRDNSYSHGFKRSWARKFLASRGIDASKVFSGRAPADNYEGWSPGLLLREAVASASELGASVVSMAGIEHGVWGSFTVNVRGPESADVVLDARIGLPGAVCLLRFGLDQEGLFRVEYIDSSGSRQAKLVPTKRVVANMVAKAAGLSKEFMETLKKRDNAKRKNNTT